MIIYFDDTAHTVFGLDLLKGTELNLLPDAEAHIMDVPGKAGSYLFSSSFRERRFKFPFTIVRAPDDIELNKALGNIKEFFTDDFGQLRTVRMHFSHQPDRYYNVRLNGATPMSREFAMADIEIEFVASDPFAYSKAITAINLNTSTGSFHTFEQVTVPVIEFTLNETIGTDEFKVTTQTSDGRGYDLILDYPPTFRGGDKVKIDLERNLVTINGDNAMSYLRWQESDFFTIPKGMTTFTFTQYWKGVMTYTQKWL